MHGYARELERIDELEAGSIDPSEFYSITRGEPPAEMDPRTWCRIENQKSMGSCQGHAQTTVCETAFRAATNGQIIQFSPLFAYYATQKIDGLNGSDRGSTIAGGVKSAKENGQCPLDIMPYPNPVRYHWSIPEIAYKAAKDYLIGYSLICKSYEDILSFIQTGQGAVEFGVEWNSSIVPDSKGYINDVQFGGGGHALCFNGYTGPQELDPDGKPYLWMANSWDTVWGDKGWAKVSSRVVTKWLNRRGNVFIGMSDMKSPKFRKIDYSLW